MTTPPSPRVYLMQLLCPHRHAIVASMFDPATTSPSETYQTLETLRLKFNEWCGICGSRELRYETRPTKFASLAEATAAARMLEAENIETRRELDVLGLTYDSRQVDA